jgi:Protein of unknown function (DUF2934)
VTQNQAEQIALRAYLCWEKRGRPVGTPEADWYRAEKELAQARLSKVARKAGWMAGKVVAIINSRRRLLPNM